MGWRSSSHNATAVTDTTTHIFNRRLRSWREGSQRHRWRILDLSSRVPETAHAAPNSRPLLAVGAGTVSALTVSWALHLLLPASHRTLTTAFVFSLDFVLLACAGGALGYWSALRLPYAASARRLTTVGMRSWMFITAAVSLLAQRSPLALLAASVTAGFTVGSYWYQEEERRHFFVRHITRVAALAHHPATLE